jgi:hypothetical protein
MNGCMKRTLGFVSVAVFIGLTSQANAQVVGDGSTAAQAAAQRANVSVTCGAQVGGLVRTENAGLSFSNTSFATLSGSGVSVTVPSGATRCIKVLFTAEAGATNFCYVRAILDGIVMSPDGGGAQALVSHDTTNNGHAFEWARRVGSGTHTVSIQRRVNAGTCNIDDWTVDVSSHQ